MMPNSVTPVAEARSVDPQADPSGLIVGGRYRLETRIGLGGMGAVYRALDTHVHQRVAVKVLHSEFSEQQQYVRRFEREAQAAERIRHPNIVRLLDRGRLTDGQFYLVLEFIRGQNLKAALAHGPIAVSRAASIARQVARAMQAAHSAGVVHRDLKPENIMLAVEDKAPVSSASALRPRANDDVVKILDFGIAKLENRAGVQSEGAPLTQFGSVFGTPEYMSPEQAAGLPVDARSDLYSAGVIFYELIAGRTPFASDEALAILSGHITATPPALPTHVPPALVTVISRLLAKDPAHRFATAEQLLAALDNLDRNSSADGLQLPPSSRNGGVTRTAPPGIVRRPRVQHRRGPLGLQGRGIGLWVAGCALAAIGAAMVLGYRGPNKPSFEVTPGAQFHAAAAQGDDAAIAQLLALPDAERTGTDWLALAQGHEANGNPAEATDALQRALVVEPELAPVPEIRSLVWEIVATPPLAGERTAGAVVELTQKHLEEHAPDLLWAIADEDTLSGETQRAALNALQPLVEEASEAVQTALATRQAQSCQQLQGLAERISEHGDVRTADVLTELERVQECPASGLCGQCITQNPSLVQAKSAAASRPLPHLDFK